MIADNRGDMKKLWRTFSAVSGTHPITPNSQPSSTSSLSAEDFFSVDKVAAVQADTGASKPDVMSTASEQLSSLVPLSVSEVQKLISHAANSQCFLDPAPT